MAVQDSTQEYVFDPTWDLETERLITNEAIWDPGTIERFERLGVGPGWSCLEIGAGNGGAAAWLAERTGPTGRVVVADLEIDRLGRLSDRGVEVRQHDIRTEDFPAESFDLVHARMLVQHLPDRQAAVARMIRALRPGGLLFLEDTDSLPLFRSYRSERFLTDIKAAGYGIMRRAGHEPRGGHFDLEIALNSELTEVTAEGRVVMVHGGSPQARHYQLWLEFMRSKIVAEKLLTHERIDEALAEMGDPANRWLSQVLISTYGRKPKLP
jgi:SAM-dependent methyltransferase